MCDTMVAPPTHTAGDVMLFGKNSDRQRNEAQAVERIVGTEHGPDARLKCTYMEIPQARRTWTVILCRPFWLWGAEMGANEHGLVIGNEAVHARTPACERAELPGPDLVRLGLERATCAAEAIEVMTSLLARHGGGGNCGHLTPAYFNNGFIVADPREAYVLEMVEREWLTERIQGPRTISNAYSIGRGVERCSAGLAALLRERGWSSESPADCAQAIANPNREHIGHARARRARSTYLLQSADRALSVATMMSVVRDHGSLASETPDWHPDQGGALTLCMHAGSEDRIAQTCGTMVSELGRDQAVHWVTGTAAPCTSVFKPVLLDVPLPESGPPLTDRFDPRTLWWRHEALHRAAILDDFAGFLSEIHGERDALEAEFRSRVHAVVRGSTSDRAHVVAQCWADAHGMEERWHSRLRARPSQRRLEYRLAWEKMNDLAGISLIAAGDNETQRAGFE
jgi:secernin